MKHAVFLRQFEGCPLCAVNLTAHRFLCPHELHNMPDFEAFSDPLATHAIKREKKPERFPDGKDFNSIFAVSKCSETQLARPDDLL